MEAAAQIERDREWALATAPSDAGAHAEGAVPGKDLSVAGVWAPDVGACSAQNRKRLIPAVITPEGASAGDTFCAFRNKRQSDAGLEVIAKCSNAQRQWTTKVRLTVSGNRLTWTSQRGTQAYWRCEPNTRMASAHQ